MLVEINYELTYRTYMYDNPSCAKCDVETIYKEERR